MTIIENITVSQYQDINKTENGKIMQCMYSYLFTGIKIAFINERRICNKYKHVTVINSKHYHVYNNTTCNPYENKYIYYYGLYH